MLFADKKIKNRRLQHRRRERSGAIKLLIVLIMLCSLLLLLALYLYLAFFHSNKSKKTLSINPVENNNQKTIAIQRTIVDNEPEEPNLNLFFDEIKDIYYNLSTMTVVSLDLISYYSNDDILRPFDDEIKSAAVNFIRKIRRFKTLTYNMERNQEKFNLIYVFLDTYATLIRVQRLAYSIRKNTDGIRMIFSDDYIFDETLNMNQDIQMNILIVSRILNPLLRIQIKIMDLYKDELKLCMNNILNKEHYEKVILRIKEAMLKTASSLMIKRKIEINGWPEQSNHNNVDEDPTSESEDDNGYVIKEAFLIQSQIVLEEFVLLSLYPIYILMFEFKEKEKDFEHNQLILRKEFKDQIKIGAEFKYQQEEGSYIKLSVNEIYNDVVHDLEGHCSGVFAEYLTDNIENHSESKFDKIHCFDAMEKAFILVSAGPVVHQIFDK